MFLRWVSSLNQPMQCIILGDNEQVIRTANVQSYVMASRSSHGTWIKAYSSLQAQMPTFVSTQFAWIKGHAGFQGNECSNLFSKWIAHSSSSSPELLPPPPLGTGSFGSLPACHRLTTSISRALIPRHHHYNIHVPSSFYFYNHSSWFSGLPFKWSSGNMNFLTYAFHNDLTPRICHKCSQSHPLDVASFLSHCPSADHIVQSFIHAWPPPLNQVASIWWAQCSHPGDKQNFGKFLVPSNLYDAMTTPTTGETKPQRVLAFRNALPQRQQQLKDALSKALTWLTEDPPPLPRPPPQGANTWGKPHSTYSTSHTPLAHGHYHHPLPPEHLPDSVQPPPSKNHAPTKTKSPCVPSNHPRNAAGTLKTLHHAKHVVTPTPLNRWHPPNPPALTVPTDGLHISSKLQPPPPASGRAAPISEFNARVFFTPPPSLALPPPSIRFILGQTQSEPRPK